jgi:4-amino-4-deoxy-L-arabinose transferase-like glycosyltransferase
MKPHSAVLLAAGIVTVACALAGSLAPLVDRDEPRYAEAAREMRATGDWIVPRNFGRLFADKPPLLYWAQAASVSVLGDDELALRLPSALCAGLLVVLAGGIAMLLGGDPVRAAAFVMPGVVAAGFLSTPDALVCAATALSLWGFLRAAAGVQSALSATLAWVALAAGILAKGPVAPLFVGAAMAGRLWRDPGAARRLGWAWGVPLVILLPLAWFLPANLATGWRIARLGIGVEVIGRALGPMERHGVTGVVGVLLGPLFYAVSLAVASFPAVLAVRRWWRGRHELAPAAVRTTLAGLAIPLAVLSLAATKLPHYVLPALPLVAAAVAAHPLARPMKIAAWAVSALLLVAAVGVARQAPWRAVAREAVRRGGAVTPPTRESSLLYYGGGLVRPLALPQLAARIGTAPAAVILDASQLASLEREASGLTCRALQTWRGRNLVHGTRVEVGLYRCSREVKRER